jgi:hypothetical protein
MNTGGLALRRQTVRALDQGGVEQDHVHQVALPELFLEQPPAHAELVNI